jgi:hypothetical protein
VSSLSVRRCFTSAAQLLADNNLQVRAMIDDEQCEKSNVSKAVWTFWLWEWRRCPAAAKTFNVMSTRSKKQVVADYSNPLDHAGLLELILELVGPGEALFIRCVDSNWKACYDKLSNTQHANSKEHVHTSSCTTYQAVFASASRVTEAHDLGLPLSAESKRLQHCAGKYGDIGALCAAQELGLVFSPILMRGAASSIAGLQKLQWLCAEQHCPLPDNITATAARAGNAEMLRWLKGRGCLFNEQTSRIAAGTPDNLQVLQYLYEQGCPWHDSWCGAAGRAVDLEQLKWLHAHGALLDDCAVLIAASGGAVHVFQWLQQQGVDFLEITMSYSAMYGHLQLCQWLCAQQCPWDDSVTHAAAMGRNCELLRWLIESGCPYDAHEVCTSFVYWLDNNDFSTLQYLYDCDIMTAPAVLTDTLNAAGSLNNLAVARWLRQHGAEWPAVLWSAIVPTPWRGDVLAWARAEGCTSPTEW